MVRIVLNIMLIFLFVSCEQLNKGKPVYYIHEKDLFPEGIAYSSLTNALYVSSIKKTKIIQIDMSTGKEKDFVKPEIIRMGVLGLAVDDNKKLLWACANINSEGKRYSAIFKFDLYSDKLLNSFNNKDTIAATYNDLTIDKSGDVYFTNTNGNQVYRINATNDSMYVFYCSNQIEYPNGITISPDNNYLYIASQTRGIRILDIENKKIINSNNTSINSMGIDGLKYYKNSLIGIQNGLGGNNSININRYYLSKDNKGIIGVKTIDKNNSNFDIPTTCAISNGKLFCIANSQLGNLNHENYSVRNPKFLKDIIIISYKL